MTCACRRPTRRRCKPGAHAPNCPVKLDHLQTLPSPARWLHLRPCCCPLTAYSVPLWPCVQGLTYDDYITELYNTTSSPPVLNPMAVIASKSSLDPTMARAAVNTRDFLVAYR